jgi:hypothetical protein
MITNSIHQLCFSKYERNVEMLYLAAILTHIQLCFSSFCDGNLLPFLQLFYSGFNEDGWSLCGSFLICIMKKLFKAAHMFCYEIRNSRYFSQWWLCEVFLHSMSLAGKITRWMPANVNMHTAYSDRFRFTGKQNLAWLLRYMFYYDISC